jgi:hypothetical protein
VPAVLFPGRGQFEAVYQAPLLCCCRTHFLYAKDGAFYAALQHHREAVRKAYDVVFSEIRLTVKFNVAEIAEMSGSFL